MTDTPETDAEANNGSLCDQCVPADFARKLERERDEAIRYADTLAELLPVGMLPKDIENIRDANYQMAQDIYKLERERDEARFDLAFRRDLYKLQESQLNEIRKQLAEAVSSCHIWQSGHSALVRDRNEALWERDRLTNKIAAEREGWKTIAVELEKELAIVCKQNNERLTLLQEHGLAEYGN